MGQQWTWASGSGSDKGAMRGQMKAVAGLASFDAHLYEVCDLHRALTRHGTTVTVKCGGTTIARSRNALTLREANLAGPFSTSTAGMST